MKSFRKSHTTRILYTQHIQTIRSLEFYQNWENVLIQNKTVEFCCYQTLNKHITTFTGLALRPRPLEEFQPQRLNHVKISVKNDARSV